MRLFKRKKEENKPQRHELCDIPVGSMVEMSDSTTVALEEQITQTFEIKAYKKYEAEDFLRYMYQLVDEDEELILGINMDPETGECQIARFIIDSEEEFNEALGDSIVMEFGDTENEGETISIEYIRDSIISVTMSVVTADEEEKYDDIELQEYSAEDGTIMSAELWESWFTFYIGELIQRADVNVFPIEKTGK